MSQDRPKAMKPQENPYAEQRDIICKLWHQSDIDGIERIALLGLTLFLMLMPAMAVRWVAWHVRNRVLNAVIDVYVMLRLVALFVFLVSGLASRGWVLFFASVLLVDMYAYLIGIIFLRRFWAAPISYSRSLILLAFNFVEFVASFAIFYTYSRCLSFTSSIAAVTEWSDAFYFSTVTSATVGYGDIVPTPGLGRILVTLQIFLALSFMAMIVAHFVSNIDSIDKVKKQA